MIWPCYDVGKFTIWGYFTPSKNFFLRSLKQLQPNMFLLDKIIVIWNKRVVYKLKLSVVISIWLALSQASLEFKTSIFREVFLPLLLFFDWGFLTQNCPLTVNCCARIPIWLMKVWRRYEHFYIGIAPSPLQGNFLTLQVW